MILEIVSPEATLFKGNVNSVSVPGIDGEFQMLNNHAAIVSVLAKGNVKINISGNSFSQEDLAAFKKVSENVYWLPIKSGTIEMSNNKVIVLAD